MLIVMIKIKKPSSHFEAEKPGFTFIEAKLVNLEINKSKADLKSLVDFSHHFII